MPPFQSWTRLKSDTTVLKREAHTEHWAPPGGSTPTTKAKPLATKPCEEEQAKPNLRPQQGEGTVKYLLAQVQVSSSGLLHKFSISVKPVFCLWPTSKYLRAR